MKTIFKLQLAAMLTVLCLHAINAQTLPGTYSTSWVGNTYVPATQNYDFVQNWANSIYVESNGTIYTNSYWEEGAKEMGIYKDGKCIGSIPNQHEHADGGAITANKNYIWGSVHNGKISRFLKNTYEENGIEFRASTDIVRGLAATESELYVSDFANNKIKVFNANLQGTLIRSWDVTKPGPLAIDTVGNLWVLRYDINSYGPGTGNCISCYSASGNLLKTITLANGVLAKSIALDTLKGELFVTDIGDNMQVHIYKDIYTTPVFAESFGQKGGILSGVKGLVAPLKFNVPNFAAPDGNGNIIVWSNGNNTDAKKPIDADGMGTCIESYTRNGALNWQMLGLEFVDMGTVDPWTDGADLYTKHEHFTMDYSKPEGKQWTWKGWTVDRVKYPDDVRLHNGGGHLSTTFMRRVNGNLYMYLTNMASGGWWIYRFDPKNEGETAIPCGTISNWENLWIDNNGNGKIDNNENANTIDVPTKEEFFARNVDNKGTIWFARIGGEIYNYPVQSINSYGVPVYSPFAAQVVDAPAPFTDIRRIQYDSDNDVMYLTGYTAALPNSDNNWGIAGRVLARYNNWSKGNRNALYVINDLPYNPTTHASAISFAVEKDYIFVCGVTSKGKVWVYNASNGSLAGTMVPGSNIGGVDKTGWCDLRLSIAAHKRVNGSYIVSVEEDAYAKIILYDWKPNESAGICDTIPVESLTFNNAVDTVYGDTTLYLKHTLLPLEACRSIQWRSLDSTVLKFINQGVVSTIKPGIAKLVMNINNDLFSDTCTIIVNDIPVQSVTTNFNAITLPLFTSKKIDATIFPNNSLNKNLKWISTDTSIVMVDQNGLITAVNSGATVKIIVSTIDELVADTCIVTVPLVVRKPFGGTNQVIPGIVEFENFDTGIDGLTWHDLDTVNHGKQYRKYENVDIETCTEGGYNVGWTNKGEWLVYTVNVLQGEYDIFARIASPDAGNSFDLLLNDTLLCKFTSTATGDWQNWTSIAAYGINMAASNNSTLKIALNSGGLNINKLTFVKSVPIESMSINYDKVKLKISDSIALVANVLPLNTTRSIIKWTTSNSQIAKVNSSGMVKTLNKTGSAYIYAKSDDGKFKDSCLVEVIIPLVSVKINPKTVKLGLQQSITLKAEFTPINTTQKIIHWSTNNAQIATVDNTGKVNTLNVSGSAYIYLKSDDGLHTDSCFIEVEPSVINGIAYNTPFFKVYPNPAMEYVNIVFEPLFETKNVNIEIINIIGISEKLTYSKVNETITINTSSLKPGYYYIKVKNGNSINLQKLIIQ